MIIEGAYGPYVKGPGRRNNVRVPKEVDPRKITLEEAEKMLAEKPKGRRVVRRGKKAGAKKAVARRKSRGKK